MEDNEDKVIKLRVLADLERFFEESKDKEFLNLKKEYYGNAEYTQEELDEIENVFASLRNYISNYECMTKGEKW